ncbi:ABC transporter permease [Aeromonas veronii]|uniref:ABC transporter permease n=1 Tax=Aeromonas veronii TaxID=654 RepID=UPI0031FC4138
MSNEMLLTNIVVVLILIFILACAFFCSQDVTFSFLNLFRHKRRSFSTIAAIIFGGVSIFLYGGFIDYSFWILKEQIIRTNIGHVQIYNQNYFETSNKKDSLIADYPALKKILLNTPELAKQISTLSGQLEFTGVVSQYESNTSSYFSGLGVEPLPSLKLGSFDKLIIGSDLSRVRHDEITLGSGLASTLNSKYDDWLDLIVVNTQGGQGALSLKLRGIFESGIKDYDDVAMKLPLDTAQRMMGTDGVSKVLILLNDEDSTSFIIKLRQLLAQQNLPLIVKEWKEVSLFYQQVEGLLSGIYFFIKLIVALIVVFMISNAMTMNIIERTREITTLRAIGLKPLHVTRLFLLEGIFVGVIGAVGSLGIGWGIASVINLYGIVMPPSPGQSLGYTAFIKTTSYGLIWITVVLPILTATAASISPALRASRLNIADAFKLS